MNPWILLAVAIAWGASLVGADHFGATRTENRLNAETGKQIDALVKQHNADSVIDMQAAAEVATKEAQAKTRANQLRGQANEAVAATALPAACLRVPDQRFWVLLASVKAANGDSETAAPSVLNAIDKAVRPAK